MRKGETEYPLGSFHVNWQKKMVSVRRACRPEMNYGDFLDDLGLGPVPAHTYARLFRRADRGRLALTLLDRRKDPRTPFTVSVNLKTAGVGPASKLTLVTLDGEQPLPVPQAHGDSLEIAVPVFPPRVAAVLIECAKEAK